MVHVDPRNSWRSVSLHRQALIIATGGVICLALLLAAQARSDQWPYRSAPTPFCLNIKVIAYDHGPVGKLRLVQTEARRSDGLTVTIDTTYPRHRPSLTFRVMKMPDGTRISLADSISSKSTCRPKRQDVPPSVDTSPVGGKPPCRLRHGDMLLGQTVLFGQQVELVKTWYGSREVQEWLAPALGCKLLQWRTATLQPDGSRRIENEGKLVSFALGEPDARLFDPGTSYAEVTSSEMLRRVGKAAGLPWSPEAAEEGIRDDQFQAATCQEAVFPQK